MWVVENTPLAKPQLITTDASSYADGVITFFMKGRGIADCVNGEERVWDGRTFVQSLKYTTGMCREITPGGTWMLPTFVSQVRPKQQKDADNLALKALYNAVLKEQKSDPELALKKVAAQFPLTGHVTNFTLTYADDSLVSTNKPAVDISDDEWQAFLHSDISADSENGKVSFTLVDLDNDGKRDLIIDSYIGGTGLFSYTGVLRRGIIRLIPSIIAIPMTTMILTLAYPGRCFPSTAAAPISGTSGSESTARCMRCGTTASSAKTTCICCAPSARRTEALP